MAEVWVARYLPSALACSAYQCVLSRGRDRPTVLCGLGHAVLPYQPFCCGWINKRHIDLVSVLLAELLKRPVGDKGVHDSKLAGGNPGLYLGHGHAKKIRYSFPRICVIPGCQDRGDSFDGGGVQRCTNLVTEYRQGACRYARIAHSQHAVSDEATEMMGATYA